MLEISFNTKVAVRNEFIYLFDTTESERSFMCGELGESQNKGAMIMKASLAFANFNLGHQRSEQNLDQLHL